MKTLVCLALAAPLAMSAQVIPLRPELEPVIGRAAAPNVWRLRAALLAMTALTAASVLGAVFAGSHERAAVQRADHAQQLIGKEPDPQGQHGDGDQAEIAGDQPRPPGNLKHS